MKTGIFGILLVLYSLWNPLLGRCFEFYSEFLYVQPSVEDSFFAVDNSAIPINNGNARGKRHANEQNWDFGYRLGAIYNFCFWEAELKFTNFPSFKNRNFASNVVPTLVSTATQFLTIDNPSVSISQEIDLYDLDFIARTCVWTNNNWKIALQGGIKYGHLLYKEHSVSREGGVAGSTDRVDFRSHLFGIGPTFGIAFCGHLLRCISLVGHLEGACLISRWHATENLIESTLLTIINNFRFDNEYYWKSVPTIDTKIGLRCCPNFCFCHLHTSIELGYTIISYFKAIDRIRTINNSVNTGQTFDQFMTYTLHGPYARLAFVF